MRTNRNTVAEALPVPSTSVRTFSTGANRSVDTDKPDYEGFLSPLMIEAFGVYMHYNRLLPDGSVRASDNWQKGIPVPEYVKSLLRHTFDVWRSNRGLTIKENIVWALCGVIFNAQGVLHELMSDDPKMLERYRQHMEESRSAKIP